MLELIVNSLLEVANLLVQVRKPNAKSRKALRGLIRFHWILERIEEHSRVFINGLEIVRDEGRIPIRLEVALEALCKDLEEAIEMIDEDEYGTGFWHIVDLFIESGLQREFIGVVGVKLERLRAWQHLINQGQEKVVNPSSSRKLLALTENFNNSEYAKLWYLETERKPEEIEDLLRDGKLQIIDLSKPEQLKAAIKNAENTLRRVTQMRKKLGELLKENFELTDILEAT